MIVLLAIMIVGQYAVSTKLISSGGLIVCGFSQLCTFLVVIKGLLPLADTMKWILILVAWFFGYTGLVGTLLFSLFGVRVLGHLGYLISFHLFHLDTMNGRILFGEES